jgi:hypothetical protein
MVFLLQGGGRDGDTPRRDPNALRALLVTMFTLVITMITYSVIAGEREIGGRAAASELVTGLTFIFAIFMLFYSLQLLLENSVEYTTATKTVRWIVVVISPVIGLMFLVLGADDTEYVRSESAGPGMLDVATDPSQLQ